jgi:catechol 2,3-dioxygenase-like lactoylglutathione lyase family enzyme
MIDNFSHITINCRSLENSVRFYESIGLRADATFGEADLNRQGVATAFGLPTARLKVAHLLPREPSENMRIDLVEWLEPPLTGAAYPALNYPGLARLCFRVTDIEGTVQALRARGVAFISDPQPFGAGIRSACCTDPDGTFIQLIEGLKEVLERK